MVLYDIIFEYQHTVYKYILYLFIFTYSTYFIISNSIIIAIESPEKLTIINDWYQNSTVSRYLHYIISVTIFTNLLSN